MEVVLVAPFVHSNHDSRMVVGMEDNLQDSFHSADQVEDDDQGMA